MDESLESRWMMLPQSAKSESGFGSLVQRRSARLLGDLGVDVVYFDRFRLALGRHGALTEYYESFRGRVSIPKRASRSACPAAGSGAVDVWVHFYGGKPVSLELRQLYRSSGRDSRSSDTGRCQRFAAMT
jgi:hypothetical protein